MLSVSSLTYKYPDNTPALNAVSFDIADSESVALIGGNGAGKTTLILALAGVLDANGSICLNGITLSKATLRQIRQSLGIVFQNPDDQLFMSNIFEDVAFGLRNMHRSEVECTERVDACLESLGIAHLKSKSSLRLSGGEKRMAALASVLVMEPSLLIMDEPTAFLDPVARRRLINTTNALSCSKLIATHDLSFALQTCGRCIALKDGSIFAIGDTKDLLYDIPLMNECSLEAIQCM